MKFHHSWAWFVSDELLIQDDHGDIYLHWNSYPWLQSTAISFEDTHPWYWCHAKDEFASSHPHPNRICNHGYERPFTKVKNSKWLNIESCQTSVMIGIKGEISSSTWNLDCAWLMKAAIQFRKTGIMERASSFARSKRWLTTSKTFGLSRKTMSISCFLFSQTETSNWAVCRFLIGPFFETTLGAY